MQTLKAFLVITLAAASAQAQVAGSDLNEAWWAAIGPDGVQRVNIRCGADFFDPRQIVVKANVPVQLSVSTTSGLASHKFSASLGAIVIDVPVGAAPKKFVVSPGLAGKFQALCSGPSDDAKAKKAKTGYITVVP